MTIHQRFTGDSSQLVKAYQDVANANVKLEQRVGELARKMGEVGRAAKGGTDQMQSGMKGVAQDLAGAIAGYVSLRSVIAAVNEELEHKKKLQAEAFQANSSLAPAQADMILNSFGDSPEQIKANQQRIRKMATELHVPEVSVTQAFGDVRGTGVGNVDQQMKAVELAAKMSGKRPENMASVAKSLLMTQDLSGASAEEAAALNLSSGAAAFVTNPESQSRMLRQAMAASTAASAGDKRKAAEQAAEFTAGLSVVGGDDRGESSRTASAAIAGQMHEFFTEGIEVPIPGAGGRKRRIKPKFDPGSQMDRMEYLQNNPSDAKAFVENKLAVETQFRAPVRKMFLEKDSAEAQKMRNVRETVGYDTKQLPSFLHQIEKGTPQLAQARAAQVAESAKEQFLLANPKMGERKTADDIVTDTFEKTRDMSSGGYLMRGARDWWNQSTRSVADQVYGRDELDSAEKALKGRRQEILTAPGWLTGKGRNNRLREESELNEKERSALTLVDEGLKNIQSFRQPSQSAPQPSPQPPPSPAASRPAAAGGNNELSLTNELLREQNTILQKSFGEQSKFFQQIADPARTPVGNVIGAARAERGNQREQ